MRRAVQAACAAAVVLAYGPAVGSEEDVKAVTAGSTWVGGGVGAAKKPGERPTITSRDVRLVITDRTDDKFVARVFMGNGEKESEIGGTIGKKGAIQFVVTKVIKGSADGVVGVLKGKGRVDDGRMLLTFGSNVGTKRAGTIGLELEKPDDAESE